MKKVHISWLFPCLFLSVAVGLKSFEPGFVGAFQNHIFDYYQRLMPRAYAPVPVRIVDIDDESLHRLGQWPWPRNMVANLVDALRVAGASAIVFDIVFAEPDRTSPGPMAALWNRPELTQSSLKGLPDHDELLAKAIAQAPAVTAFIMTHEAAGMPENRQGFSFAGENPAPFALSFAGAVTTLPLLEGAAKGNGGLNNQPDPDGILRRIPLLMRVNDTLYPSLGAEGLRVAQGAGGYVVKTVGASGEGGGTRGITAVKIGNVVIPTDRSGNQWVYYSPPVPERYVPAWKILDGSADFTKIEGNIVLIGTSAAGLKDIRATPLSPVTPGVEVFAQSMEQALLGISLSRPDWIAGAEIALMIAAGVILLLVNGLLSPLWGAGFMAAMLAATAALSWQAFAVSRLLVEPVMPAVAVMLVYFSDSLRRYIRIERERQNIRNAFAQYMSPELVRELASQPAKLVLGGENRVLSVMFCDMRNFTAISEDMPPMELTQLMSRFLAPMTQIILEHHGTIDKYIGDCVMAFWNAPLKDDRHVWHAAQAALKMQQALRGLNMERENEAVQGQQPFVIMSASISINTGECCVGNMGTRQRFNYSALGDEVNLASRLEGQTKYYGVDIIVAEGTARELQRLALLELDMIRVKGKQHSVRIYTLLGDEAMAIDPDFLTLQKCHNDMLARYRMQEWEKAAEALQQCLQAARSVQPSLASGYYLRMKQRMTEYRLSPLPLDWDGVHEVLTK